MRVSFKGLCRGDGKIFIKVKVSGLHDKSNVTMQCNTKDGFSLPCGLYPFSVNSASSMYVAVIPNLPIIEELVFVELDADGKQLGNSVKKSVSSFIAKWESRLNYKIHKPLTKQIRSFDKRAQINQIQMNVWETIPLNDDKVIARLELAFPQQENVKIQVECFDEKLQKISSDPVFLGMDNRSLAWKNSATFCYMRYSVVLDNPNLHYLFTAQNLNDPSMNGFTVLKPSICKLGIEEWIKDNEPVLHEPYEKWFDSHRANAADLSYQASVKLDYEPLFSIVVPLYKTPLTLFEEMVQSVIQQSYANWELVLVNASPEDKKLSKRLKSVSETDQRIKVITLEKNLGISLNTRKGLDAAIGDYICFLDHDDTLELDTLFEYAFAINKDPNIDLLYCDEDKIAPSGEFCTPFFKPDFSIDLLRNVNYICHFLCVKKSMIDSLELYTQELDGAQDHDLTLKVAEKSDNIHHVKRVLYHWRICEGSTAADADSKQYAIDAGIRAVQNHLDRLGINAKVTPNEVPFSYDVEYLIDDINPLISIIIPSKDEANTLDTCIKSILQKSTYDNYEIIVVENNSEDPKTFEYYESVEKKYSNVKIVRWPDEFNFSKIVNFGVKNSSGEYVVLLNNDTEVITPNWLEQMLGVCRREDVGVVGVRLWYPDYTLQHAGVVMNPIGPVHVNHGLPRGNNGYFGLAAKPLDLVAVTAACIMVKRDVYDSVDGFDESFSVALNDVDFCFRIRDLGKLIVYLPTVELFHYESLSRGYENTPKKRLRFAKEEAALRTRWPEYYVFGDPYFRPTLWLG